MTVVRLYLLRHGHIDARELFYGHTDLALSELGRQQAEACAQRFAGRGLAAVWSSDLARARVGAERLAAVAGCPLHVHAGLREMHVGVLEGCSFAQARSDHPELATRRHADLLDEGIPGGESVREVAARVLPVIDQALCAAVAGTGSGPRPGIAVVAHGTVVRLVLAHAAGLDPAGFVRFAPRLGSVARVDVPIHQDRVAERVMWAQAVIVAVNEDPSRLRSEGPEHGPAA